MKLCYHCMQQIRNKRFRVCPNCGKKLDIQQIPVSFLSPGTILQDRFILGYPLGSGGFGNTYIGWDKLLLRKVAVKEFYPRQFSSRAADGITVEATEKYLQSRHDKGLLHFLDEARNVASLHDIRGVVAISNFFKENGTGYIVMEYLDGMSVKDILKKSGNKKDYKWCRRVILTVLDILRDIHKRGIVHRDIAPDNIFVTNQGVIKLIDFGAAKYETALTAERSEIVLKGGYAPIEQYSRAAVQGPYTDLYAVAALFYRMLTGQKPIPAIERIQQDALIPPSKMGIEIPGKAEMGMMVCLNVRPEHRLQSADEFMEALDGRDFIPVYEPRWILPQEEKGTGLFRKISRLPVVAKAGICFAGICLIFGIVLGISKTGYQSMQRAEGKSSTLEDGAIRLPDYTGMSAEEAQDHVHKLNRQNGWNITLDTSRHIFDPDEKNNGTICSQSVKSSIDLTSKADLESTEDLKQNADGKVEGIIQCTVYSSEKLYYSEIRGLNAFALAEKLGIDKSDGTRYLGVQEDGGRYYDIKEIQTKDGSISAEELKDEANAGKEISCDEKFCIIFYAPDFLYWKSLDSYVGKNIKDIKCASYQYDLNNEKKRKKTGRKVSLAGTSLVNENCYSFEKKKGTVVEQTRKKGETLDTSEGMDEPLLYVVKKKLTYEGKTGSQVKKEIEGKTKGWDVTVNIEGGTGQESQYVIGVNIYDKKKKTVDYFREGKKYSITITTESVPAPVPTLAPTPMPSQNVPTPASSTPADTPPAGGGNSDGGSDVGH